MEPAEYRTLPEMLFGMAADYPERKALISDNGKSLTYGQLVQATAFIRTHLAQRGMGEDSRVALMMPPGITMAATTLSMMSCVILVPLNPDNTPDELSYLFTKHAIRLLVTLDDYPVADDLLVEHKIERLSLAPDYLWQLPETRPEPWIADTQSAALVLHTSGSTAKPKSVCLTHGQLLASAKNLCRSLALTPEDTCLSVMPPFHVGAIVDLLLAPLLAKGAVIVAPDPKPDTFWKLAHELKPTWYQGVPTMLQAIVDTADQFAPPSEIPLRFIRAVSAYLPKRLEQGLKALFALPIVQIYGMTEAAGVITSNPLTMQKEGSVGIPVGPKIKVVVNHQEVGANTPGEILIRGDSIIQAYDENDEINDNSFLDGWFKTGDEGYFDEEGYFFLTGRIKEIINQGGEKISPLEIDQCVLNYGGVKQAASFSLPHETLGEEVALAVVTQGRALDVDGLRDHLKRHLSDFKCPRRIYQLEQLPMAKGGKLKRHELADLVQAKQLLPLTQKSLPTTALGKLVLSEWQKVIKQKEIYNEDDFFDLGGDSLSAATLMAAMEQRFEVQIPTYELLDHPTLGQFIQRMESLIGHESSAPIQTTDSTSTGVMSSPLGGRLEYDLQKIVEGWGGERQRPEALIVGFHTQGTLPPLYWCCQGRDELLPLVELMGVERPIYAMRSLSQLVKRPQRDNPALAARYVDEILQLQPEGPYYVGGFSEGGRIAHHIADRLEALGHTVQLLCLYDTIIDQPYHGKVSAHHCLTGHHSPYGRFNLPERGIQYLYQGDLSLYSYDCRHSDCMADAPLQRFCQDLAYELEQAHHGKASVRHVPTHFAGHPDQAQYARDISVSVPRFMTCNTQYTAHVRLKNRSTHTWPTTPDSGVTLSAKWYNLKQGLKSAKPGFLELTQPLSPEQATSFQLHLKAPPTAGLRWLEIDLFEEGVGWLTPNRTATLRKLVWVRNG